MVENSESRGISSGSRGHALSAAAALISVNLMASATTTKASLSPSVSSSQWATATSSAKNRDGSRRDSKESLNASFVSSKVNSRGVSGVDMETLRLLGVSELEADDLQQEDDMRADYPNNSGSYPSDYGQSTRGSLAGRRETDEWDDDVLESDFSEEESEGELFSDKDKFPAEDAADANWWKEDLGEAWDNESEGEADLAESDFDDLSTLKELKAQEEERPIAKTAPQKSSPTPKEQKKNRESAKKSSPKPPGDRFKKAKERASAIFKSENEEPVLQQLQKKDRRPPPTVSTKNPLSRKEKNVMINSLSSSTTARRKGSEPRALVILPSLSVLTAKLQGLTNLPIFKIAAYLAGIQMIWSFAKNRFEFARMEERQDSDMEDEDRRGANQGRTQSSSGEKHKDLNDEERKALARMGFGSKRFGSQQGGAESEEDNSFQATNGNDAPFEKQAKATSDMETSLESETAPEEEDVSSHHSPKGQNMIANLLGIKRRGHNGPTIQEVKHELAGWKERALSAEQDVETLNEQWSDTMQKLEQSKNQCLRLQSTNRYLKAQQESHQTEMEDTLKRERQKATQELARIREAMVEVLDRERKLIRDHMMSASEQVRAAVLRAEEGSSVYSGADELKK